MTLLMNQAGCLSFPLFVLLDCFLTLMCVLHFKHKRCWQASLLKATMQRCFLCVITHTQAYLCMWQRISNPAVTLYIPVSRRPENCTSSGLLTLPSSRPIPLHLKLILKQKPLTFFLSDKPTYLKMSAQSNYYYGLYSVLSTKWLIKKIISRLMKIIITSNHNQL